MNPALVKQRHQMTEPSRSARVRVNYDYQLANMLFRYITGRPRLFLHMEF